MADADLLIHPPLSLLGSREGAGDTLGELGLRYRFPGTVATPFHGWSR
jgi:hypothetical protein